MDDYDIAYVEVDWYKTFSLLPHRTISNKWVWLEVCCTRIVWMDTGFVPEPIREYGTLFDVIACKPLTML